MPWFEYIRNNVLLKVFSLALAVLIWLAVKSHLQDDSSIALNLLKNIDVREFTVPVKLLVSPGPTSQTGAK